MAIALLVGALMIVTVWSYRSLRHRRDYESTLSVAVLPFSNSAANSSQDYVATGMSAALTIQLGDLEGLEVPPLDIWNLTNPDQDLSSLAARLGLDTLLAGEVRIDGGDIRVQMRVIDPKANQSRAFQITGSLEHLIEVQHDLLASVAAELGAPLTARQRNRARRALTRSHKAYDDYLRASAYLANLAQPRGPRFATDLLHRAVQLDPSFALAHVDLSRALWRASSMNRSEAGFSPALAAAERALDRVPGLRPAVVSEVLARKGLSPKISCGESVQRFMSQRIGASGVLMEMAASYLQIGALQTAEDCFRSATDLDSENWRSWSRLGDYLWSTGRLEEARVAYHHALRASAPNTIWPHLSLTLISLQLGDYASAVQNFEKSGGEPYDSEMAYDMAIAYSVSGDLKAAEALTRAAIEKEPHQPRYYDLLGDLLESTARPDEAESAFLIALELTDEQPTQSQNGQALAAMRALIAAKAGECDRAVPEATTLRRHASQTAEQYNQLAQIFSICRQKAFALESISAALAQGFPASRIRADNHFSWLWLDDDFQVLVSDPEFTTPSE